MANFKEGLLQTIQEKQLGIFTCSELQKAFGAFSIFERKQIEQTLAILVEEGEVLSLEDGKFKSVNKQNLIKGVIKGNRRGFAFLIREDKGADLFIPNKSLNGAMHKDTVYAQIVTGDAAEVTTIISRNADNIVGTVQRNGRNAFIVPDDDSYFNDLFVANTQVENNSKVVAKIIGYEDIRNPKAKIIEVLGLKGNVDTEVLAILRSYSFSESFPENVIGEAEKLTELTENNRKDYSTMQTITIDGDDAKDFDDAISIEKIERGYRLYVHIADVSAYVRLNSVIDLEAKSRGTSVYFPSNVFPMLPEKLCNELCSLRPNEKKAALTCIMDIDMFGKVFASRIEETFITSDERMTYSNVTKILNGDVELIERYKNIYEILLSMQKLAKILSEKRRLRGGINFISKEMKVILNEKGEIIDLVKYPYEESNGIIEEFMLAANETVAEYVYRAAYPFIYRVHEAPLEEKMENLKDFLRGCDIIIKEKSIDAMQFAAILDKVKGTPIEGIVNKVMLRSMCKARYDHVHGSHFGLAAEYYCHFTSPIRRYPDLTIHRIIKDLINGKMTEKRVDTYAKLTEEVGKSSTERERAAEYAERDIDDYYKAMYMTKHVGEIFNGIISGVTNFGVFVELDNTIEGLVAIEELQGFGYTLDQKKYTLSNGITTYKLGDELKIVVESADEASRKVRFTLFNENADGENEGKKPVASKSDKRVFVNHSGNRSGNRNFDNRRASGGNNGRNFEKRTTAQGEVSANSQKEATATPVEKKFEKKPFEKRSNSSYGNKSFGNKPFGKKPFGKSSGNRRPAKKG